ncbi:hypothetical protein ACIRVK_30320 [Streptomyces sp. NPDC101152]|uniref:hypothetical protein n=1 Tax=Streptomyces sp. NPDC101152 TaxID=3366116 RepID=UPI00382C4E24
MADEQYRWLDRETAELLLRGESLEAVDAAARDQAERLAKTLESLTPEQPADAELPGEATALAAFRAARAGADRHLDGRTSDLDGDDRPVRGHDAGVVALGVLDGGARRTRWGRPARYGLVSALAACMVGGVAFAATSGILPTPFGGHGPGPAASVSAASPGRPLTSPTPNGVLGAPTPDDSTGGSPAAGTPSGTPSDTPSATPGAEAGAWWLRQAPSACRDVLGGKDLDAHRRQALENAAGGATPDRVRRYCANVLGNRGTARDGQDNGHGRGHEGDGGGNGGNGQGNGANGQGDQGGRGGGEGDGNHIGPGGAQTSFAPQLPGRLLTTRNPAPSSAPTPSPTYSTL